MDDERHKPMRADAIFRFYSMTKPIASVGLMTLYEEGRFQLDDPASKFIPELKDLKVFVSGTADSYETRAPAREMTVRDLLMHTSGLVARDAATPVGELYRRAGFAGADSEGTLADMIGKLGRIPLQVDPGSRWIYGISTDLVGYLCEVIGGLPFDRFLDERILGPLGMVDTGFTVPAPKSTGLRPTTRPRPDRHATHSSTIRKPARIRAGGPTSRAPAASCRPRPTTCGFAKCSPMAACWTACASWGPEPSS